MVATVRKLQAERQNSLSQLIDQAGRVNAEKSALDGVYKELRSKIEAEMPMGESDRLETFGDEYKAVRDYPTKKQVDVKALFKKHPDIFWRLVTVPVSVLEQQLGEVDAFPFIQKEEADMPILRILPIQKKKR